MLLRDATYVADEDHLRFFGGRSLPVMLACPSRTLEVMPYALAARAEDAGLCVCDLQVGGSRTKRCSGDVIYANASAAYNSTSAYSENP